MCSYIDEWECSINLLNHLKENFYKFNISIRHASLKMVQWSTQMKMTEMKTEN